MSKDIKHQKSDPRTEVSAAEGKGKPRLVNHLIAMAMIAALALTAYSNTFHVPFLFDDEYYVLENPNVQPKVITWEWAGRFLKYSRQTNRPFSDLTLALNYYFGRFNVFGYHLFNLFIHTASGIFLYWFVILTLNLSALRQRHGPISYRAALITGLIFICHPVHTEAVTYISQRMASMAGMFYLLAMVLYVKGRSSHGRGSLLCFGAAAVSWLLGVFTKENVALLPVFVCLYEFYFFQDWKVSTEKRKYFFILLTLTGLIALAGFAVFGSRYLDFLLHGYTERDFTLGQRILTQFRVVLYYLTLLVFPHSSRLNLDHDFLTSVTILQPPSTLMSMFIVIGLITYSILTAKKRPLFSFFTLWYFGNLAIESSILPLEMVYEYRLYLPAAGPFILFGVWVGALSANPRRRKRFASFAYSFVAVALLFCTYQTFSRNLDWKDELTLWGDCLKKSPNKARPHYNYGVGLIHQGRYAEAIAQQNEALRIDPTFAEARYNLGNILVKQGRFPEAAAQYRAAIKIKPHFAAAHDSLGHILLKQGSDEEALAEYKEAVRINSDFAAAQYHLGYVLLNRGSYGEAAAHLGEFIRLKPNHAEPRVTLGMAFVKQGKHKEAIAQYTEALRIDPACAQARYHLGNVLLNQGRDQDAITQYREAIKINPDFAAAHYNLGHVLLSRGSYEEAATHFSEAIRINPDHGEAHNNLGVAFLKQGKYEEAIAQYQAALRIDGTSAGAYYNLGLVFAKQARYKEAIAMYRQVLRMTPSHEDAYYHLALMHLKVGNREAALQEHKRLKSMNSNLADALYRSIDASCGTMRSSK
jgi:protein O-mannosyl-transferase